MVEGEWRRGRGWGGSARRVANEDRGALILTTFQSSITAARNKSVHALKHDGVTAVGVGRRNNAKDAKVRARTFLCLMTFC